MHQPENNIPIVMASIASSCALFLLLLVFAGGPKIISLSDLTESAEVQLKKRVSSVSSMDDDLFVPLSDSTREELTDGRMLIQVKQKRYVVDASNKGVIGDDPILLYQGDTNSLKLPAHHVVLCSHRENRVCSLAQSLRPQDTI